MSNVTFKAGDRARVNHKFDIMVPDRDRLVGQEGVVMGILPDDPHLMYFLPDNESARGYAHDGSWAVIDYELDKLES